MTESQQIIRAITEIEPYASSATVESLRQVVHRVLVMELIVETTRDLLTSGERTLELMPGFLDETGYTEEDEEWIPILRERVENTKAALNAYEQAQTPG